MEISKYPLFVRISIMPLCLFVCRVNIFVSWAEEAKEDMEEFIESQGIYIRQ